jgi:hypothetical protein
MPRAAYIPNMVLSICFALLFTNAEACEILSSLMCFLAACANLLKSLTNPLRAVLEVKYPVHMEC